MKRITKYRKFRKEIKKMINTFTNAYTCPLGYEAITGYKWMRHKWGKLNEKWKDYVEEKANLAAEPHFVQDEYNMSPWDYDQLFL